MIDFSGHAAFKASIREHTAVLDELQAVAVYQGLTENNEIASGYALEFVSGKGAMALATAFAGLTWDALNPSGSEDQKADYLDGVRRDYFLGAVQSISWHHDQGASQYSHRFLLVLRGKHHSELDLSHQKLKQCDDMEHELVADESFALMELWLYTFNDAYPHRVRLKEVCDPKSPLLFVSFPSWAPENGLL